MVEGTYRGDPSFPLDTSVFYSFDGGVEGMVLCVWYRGAPSLHRNTAVFSRVDGGVDWSCCAPSFSLDTAVFSNVDGGVEGMVLRGLAM